MPHQAAKFISLMLKRRVIWQLIAKSGVNTREAADLLITHELPASDVVISALGVNDVTSQRAAKSFFADYALLMRSVCERTGAKFQVISGLPPLHILPAAPQPLRWYLGQCAMRLDNALRLFCASSMDRRYVPMDWAKANEMARDKFHPGKGQYRRWAEMVAEEVVALVLPKLSLQRTASPSAELAR